MSELVTYWGFVTPEDGGVPELLFRDGDLAQSLIGKEDAGYLVRVAVEISSVEILDELPAKADEADEAAQRLAPGVRARLWGVRAINTALPETLAVRLAFARTMRQGLEESAEALGGKVLAESVRAYVRVLALERLS